MDDNKVVGLVDPHAFLDKDFNAKQWINDTVKAKSSAADAQSTEHAVATVVMRLQHLSTEINDIVAETTSQALLSIPSSVREIERIRRDAAQRSELLVQYKSSVHDLLVESTTADDEAEKTKMNGSTDNANVGDNRSDVKQATDGAQNANGTTSMPVANDSDDATGNEEITDADGSASALATSGNFMHRLTHLDDVKERLQDALHKLEHARRLFDVLDSAESSLVSGHLQQASADIDVASECLAALDCVSGFDDEKQRVSSLQDRLESALRPRALRAFEDRAATAANESAALFYKIGRHQALLELYYSFQQRAVVTLWDELFAPRAHSTSASPHTSPTKLSSPSATTTTPTSTSRSTVNARHTLTQFTTALSKLLTQERAFAAKVFLAAELADILLQVMRRSVQVIQRRLSTQINTAVRNTKVRVHTS